MAMIMTKTVTEGTRDYGNKKMTTVKAKKYKVGNTYYKQEYKNVESIKIDIISNSAKT